MMGLIHRSVIGRGPSHFNKHFVRSPTQHRPEGRESLRCHSKQLLTFRTGKFLELVSHSVLGLVDIYNLLPEYVVCATSVKLFQHRLQELLIAAMSDGVLEWTTLFCPRKPLWNNELRRWQRWVGSGIIPAWLNE